ncbi:MAG: type II secretion system protein [Gemmatimonadaceae bacterium]|nr:type II secretion system protein [Gemmatimonadaceae bacterium]
MKSRRGFTFLELLVAVVLIAIIAALGVDQAFKPITTANESVGMAQLRNAAEAALGEAVRRPGSVVTLQVGTNDARVVRDGTEVAQYRQTFPGGITASALTLTAQSDGTFLAGGSLTLASREFSYALTIDRAGHVAR